MSDILTIFNQTMDYISENYIDFRFIVERDLVWTIQKYMGRLIEEKNMPYKIYNDYPIEKGTHRSKSVDLAIIKENISYKDVLDGKEQIELAVEFKFEPSKNRTDICTHKLPVVFWDKVIKDIDRIDRFVKSGTSKMAISIFVDELGRYKRDAYIHGEFSKWIEWGNYGTEKYDVSILWSEIK